MRPTTFIASLSIAAFSCLGLAALQQDVSPATQQKPVSSVSVSYMPGTMTSGTAFAITIKKDGTARYAVRRPKMTGTFKASGLEEDFSKIAKALNDCNYWQLMQHYGPLGAGRPAVVIVVKSQGSYKKVSDAGEPRRNKLGMKSPKGLRDIEQTFVTLTSTVKWQKVSDKVDFSGFQSTGDDEN